MRNMSIRPDEAYPSLDQITVGLLQLEALLTDRWLLIRSGEPSDFIVDFILGKSGCIHNYGAHKKVHQLFDRYCLDLPPHQKRLVGETYLFADDSTMWLIVIIWYK